jgi:diguanylate cyclase (GGDEF)-like protein/PAS domain S-box-containing protein
MLAQISSGNDPDFSRALGVLLNQGSGSFFVNSMRPNGLAVADQPCIRALIGVVQHPDEPYGRIVLFNATRPYTILDVRAVEQVGYLIAGAHLRVKSENFLRDEQAARARIEECNNTGSWEYDPVQNETLWSRQMFYIHGLSPDGMVPLFDRLAAMVHPDDRTAWLSMIENASKSGCCGTLEFRIIRPDGSVRWLQARQSGRPIHSTAEPVWRLYGTVRDITEKKANIEALNRNRELLACTRKLSCLGTWEYIPATHSTYWSGEMFVLHGLDPSNGVPSIEQISAMVVKEDREKWLRMIEDVSTTGRSNKIEFRIVRPNGQMRWLLAHEGAVSRAETHSPDWFYGSLLDITEQKGMEDELRSLATTDALTQCYNRHMIMKIGVAEFDRARRHDRRLSIMFLDVDRLKTINDTLGHAAGDAALVEVSRAIAGVLRSADSFGRVGGDEFVIILPECDSDDACQIAERLRICVERIRDSLSGQRLSMTICAGVVEMSRVDLSFENIVSRADRALYHGKQSGRNQVVFEPALSLGQMSVA